VGAENAVTSRDLGILVEKAAEPVASENADVVVGSRGVGPADGWSLAEGPVRPVSVVVIRILAEDVVEMSSAGDEDAVVHSNRALAIHRSQIAFSCTPGRACDGPDVGRGEDRVERTGVLGIPGL